MNSNGKATIQVAREIFFQCAVELLKAQWRVPFVYGWKSRASSTECIQEFRMILEMKSKISPDTFNRLVVVMAMPCV